MKSVVILIFWCCSSIWAAAPTDLITERAWMEDSTGHMTFDQARGHLLTPYQGVFSRGYSESASWIRLTIAASQQPLGLRITPAWLDHITLYDPTSPNSPLTVGDHHPVHNSSLPGLGHSFTLPASATSREIWLRLETTSAHWLNAEVLPIEQVGQAASRQIVWAAIYATTLLLILFVLLALWWRQRDRVLGAYLLRHITYTLYGTTYLGLPALMFSDWLPTATYDWIFSLCAVLMLPLSVNFDQAFFSGYNPKKLPLKLLRMCGWLGIGVVLILLAGHTRLAMQLNVYALMIAVIVELLTAVSCASTSTAEQIMPKRIMVTYYALIFSSLLIGLVNLLGWFKPDTWTLYALNMHGVVSGLMMAAILIARAQRMALKSEQMGWQLNNMQQDIQKERHRRQEQTKFLQMLTHELKTPLAVARISLDDSPLVGPQRQRIDRALSNINGIIERCLVNDQLEHNKLLPQLKPCQLDQLLDECVQGCSQPSRVKVSERNEVIVQTDSELMAICLANLIDNALKYSPTASLIDVRMLREQAGITIRVRNAIGQAGVPDPQQLYTKYYRSRGALSKSGSGLGLYLTHSLAKLLGSQLTHRIDSDQVEFCLWLPA